MKKRISKKRKPTSKKLPVLITMDVGKVIHQFIEKKTPEEKLPKLCVCPLIRA